MIHDFFARNMQKQDIRIVFMGTPDFAVPTLDALVTGGYNVVGVITMPDKPAVFYYSIFRNLKNS